jgi:hypothetical protein
MHPSRIQLLWSSTKAHLVIADDHAANTNAQTLANAIVYDQYITLQILLKLFLMIRRISCSM